MPRAWTFQRSDWASAPQRVRYSVRQPGDPYIRAHGISELRFHPLRESHIPGEMHVAKRLDFAGLRQLLLYITADRIEPDGLNTLFDTWGAKQEQIQMRQFF